MKLTVPVPAELDVRLYALAKTLGVGKAELAARLLDSGLARFAGDRPARAAAAEARAAAEAGGQGGGEAA